MKDELAMMVGDRIREYREAAGMTQEEMAEMIDISAHHLSALERGLNMISVGNLMKLCKVMNVSADALLFGPGYNKEAGTVFEVPLSSMLQVKHRIRVRKALLDMVQAIDEMEEEMSEA